MSMFLAQEEDEEERDDRKGGISGLLIIPGILFLPGVILAVIIYFVSLRFCKQKSSVSNFVALLLVVSAVIYASATSAFQKFSYVFSNIPQISDNWRLLVPAMVTVNLIVGGIAGAIAIMSSIHQMRTNPHLLHLQGNWMYGFTFNRSPLEFLRWKRTIRGLRTGAFADDTKAPLGLDEEHGDSVAYRYDTEAQKQTLISGAAGSGKTITMLSLMYNDILNGHSCVVIDFKRSPELATKLATWAFENGRKFYHFVNGDPERYDVPNSPGQSCYDPLINGGAAKADMVLGMREYDTASEVYKANMRQLLQVLFSMLRQADRAKAPHIDWNHGSIGQVASAVTGSNFSELTAACEGKPIQQNAEEVDIGTRSRSSNLRHAMEELQGQMRTIIASEYGRWLKLTKDIPNIDLYKLTSGDEGNVILFSLNADSEKDFSKYVGSLIFSDLNALSSLRRNNGLDNQVNVYVDEFQAVPPTSVTNLLEKSRESKLAMTLSSQSYEQIIAASERNGEAYLIGILDTCSNFIVHNGATEDSATRLSKIIGKHWETVYRQTNANRSFFMSWNWSNRRNNVVQKSQEERWKVHPKKFMDLSSPTRNNGFRSTAVIINKATDDPLYRSHKGALARTVWMIPNQRVVDKYYMPRLSGSGSDSEEEANAGLNLSDDSVMDFDPMKPQRAPENEDDDFMDNPGLYVEDTEDEDGGFEYESLTDPDAPDDSDSDDLGPADQSEVLEPVEVHEVEKNVKKTEPRKAPKRAPSLSDLYSGVGIPVSNQGTQTQGRKISQKLAVDDDDDDDDLPDIF